jgi:hypothetical protein
MPSAPHSRPSSPSTRWSADVRRRGRHGPFLLGSAGSMVDGPAAHHARRDVPPAGTGGPLHPGAGRSPAEGTAFCRDGMPSPCSLGLLVDRFTHRLMSAVDVKDPQP